MSVSVARALASVSEVPADFEPSSAAIVRRYIIVSVILILLCAAHAIWIGTPRFPYDDPYITARNAQLLITGAQDHSFVGTPALAGSTSIVHTAEVALLALVFPPLWAAIVSQYIGIVLYGCAVVALTVSARLQEVAAWLLIAIALTIGSPFLQLLDGLETSLAMAAVAMGFALVMRKKPSGWLMFLAGTLPFIRPELAAFSLLLFAWQTYLHVKAGSDTRLIFRVLQDIGLVILGAAPFILLSVWNTGSVVPATISAKRFFFAEAHLAPAIKWRWVRFNLLDFYRVIGAAALGALCLVTEVWGALLLSFIPVFVAAFYLQFPGALGHYDHRYLYVLVPFALAGLCLGLKSQTKLVRMLWLCLLVLMTVQQFIGLERDWQQYVRYCSTGQTELASLGKFCTESLEPNARILIHDAGYMAFATKFQLVDFVGLKTPAAIPLNREFTYPSGGKDRHKAIDLLARQTAPDYLIVLLEWERVFGITKGLEADGWKLELVRKQTDFDPHTLSYHYAVYKMSKNDAANMENTKAGQPAAAADSSQRSEKRTP